MIATQGLLELRNSVRWRDRREPTVIELIQGIFDLTEQPESYERKVHSADETVEPRAAEGSRELPCREIYAVSADPIGWECGLKPDVGFTCAFPQEAQSSFGSSGDSSRRKPSKVAGAMSPASA